MTYDSISLLAQKELNDLGYYSGPLDGLWGARSALALTAWAAHERAVAAPVASETSLAQFDKRTELNLATLLPAACAAARLFMAAILPAMAAHGLTVKITSGNRTYAEQDALYEQGRTKPGSVVTNAPGGFSNHNFGLAWDITLFDRDGKPVWDSPYYVECATIGQDQNLDCGAFWSSIHDEPHYGLKTGLTMAQLRERMVA